ncbi:GntR family transcriptional regulator [Cupriavidus basilensis]
MFETLAEMERCGRAACDATNISSGQKVLAQAHKAAGPYVEQRDTASYIEANRKFHEVLYQAAANPFLTEQIVQLRRRLAIYWQQKGLINDARVPSSYREHGDVIEAVLTGNPDGAAEAMRSISPPGNGNRGPGAAGGR